MLMMTQPRDQTGKTVPQSSHSKLVS